MQPLTFGNCKDKAEVVVNHLKTAQAMKAILFRAFIIPLVIFVLVAFIPYFIFTGKFLPDKIIRWYEDKLFDIEHKDK